MIWYGTLLTSGVLGATRARGPGFSQNSTNPSCHTTAWAARTVWRIILTQTSSVSVQWQLWQLQSPNCMQLSPSWEADSYSQEIPCSLCNLSRSPLAPLLRQKNKNAPFLRLQQPDTCACSVSVLWFIKCSLPSGVQLSHPYTIHSYRHLLFTAIFIQLSNKLC